MNLNIAGRHMYGSERQLYSEAPYNTIRAARGNDVGSTLSKNQDKLHH